MSGNWIHSNWMGNGLRVSYEFVLDEIKHYQRTPCLEPKYAPIAERGAETPNQRSTIRSIVPECAKHTKLTHESLRHEKHLPNGTAPEEPAVMRNKFNKKTTANMNLFTREHVDRFHADNKLTMEEWSP